MDLAHNISANFGSSVDIFTSIIKLSFPSFLTRYLIAIILLWELNGKVVLISPNIDWRKVTLYIKSGTFLPNFSNVQFHSLSLGISLSVNFRTTFYLKNVQKKKTWKK